MSLAQKALRAAGASWAGSLGGFVIRFALNAVLLRLIVPAKFGVFALASVYVEILAILLAPTFAQAILQFEEPPEQVIPVVLRLNAFAAGALLLLALAASAWVARTDSPEVAWLIPVLALSRALPVLFCTYDNVLQREMAFGRLAALRTGSIALSMVLAVVVAWLGAPLLALALRELLPYAGSAVGFVRTMLPHVTRAFRPSAQSPELRRRVLALGKGIFSMRAIEIVYQRADQLLLGNWLGPAQLALYSQSRYLAGLPHAALTGATQNVAMQVMVTVSSAPDRFRRTNELLQLASSHVVVTVAIALFFAPRLLVEIAFGQAWGEAAEVLPYLAPWVVLYPLAQNTQTTLMVLELWPALRASQILQLLTLCVASPLLLAGFGARGAALSVSLPVIVGGAWMRRCVPREIRTRFGVYRGTVGGLLAVAATHALTRDRFAHDPHGELAASALAIAAYVGAVLLTDPRGTRSFFVFIRTALGRSSVVTSASDLRVDEP